MSRVFRRGDRVVTTMGDRFFFPAYDHGTVVLVCDYDNTVLVRWDNGARGGDVYGEWYEMTYNCFPEDILYRKFI